MEAFAVPSNAVLALKESGCPPEHVERLVTKEHHVGPHVAAMEYNLTAPGFPHFIGDSLYLAVPMAATEVQGEWDRQVDAVRTVCQVQTPTRAKKCVYSVAIQRGGGGVSLC